MSLGENRGGQGRSLRRMRHFSLFLTGDAFAARLKSCPSRSCSTARDRSGEPLRHPKSGRKSPDIYFSTVLISRAGGPLQRGKYNGGRATLTRKYNAGLSLKTVHEITGGAPLLALFEKGPAEQPTTFSGGITPGCNPSRVWKEGRHRSRGHSTAMSVPTQIMEFVTITV
jgi:hypothetical protein